MEGTFPSYPYCQYSWVRRGVSFRILPVTLASRGFQLQGELLLPEAEGPLPGAILCHGLGSDRRAMRPCAVSLARQGIATLIFDFNGHGRSTGICDGEMTPDVMAAIEYLRGHPKVDPHRTALVGHSMGARAAILTAAELDDVFALVSLACPTDIDRHVLANLLALYKKLASMGAAIFDYPRIGPLPWLGKVHGGASRIWMWLRGYRLRINWQRCFELWAKAPLSAAVQRMKPRPMLFVHCRGDRISPYRGSLELYEKAQPPKELLLADGGFHASPLLPGRIRERWMGWLVSVLKGDKPPQWGLGIVVV